VGIPQVKAQLFIFYVACHTGDIVNSVHCFKLIVVRVMYCGGRNIVSFVFGYILAKLKDTRLNVRY